MEMNLKHLGICVAIVVAVGITAPHFLGDSDKEPSAAVIAPLVAVASLPAAPQEYSNAPDHLHNLSQAKRLTSNSFELSRDLRAIYEQHKASNNASERYTAYRAWTACFPTFVSPNGQLASIDALTHALPKDGKLVDRENAYRAIQARCLSFSYMSRDEMLDANRNQQAAHNRGDLMSPGEQAEKFLTEGNKESALKTMHDIIAAGDPYAISSLREFVNQFIVLQVDAQAVHSDERPDLRSLAFTLAACHLGLECGPTSLSALQLCASMGECVGSVADRYLQALPNQADRDAVAIETRRVLTAIGAGDLKALGLQ